MKLAADKAESREKRIARAIEFLHALPFNVEKAFVYGSVARGDFVEESDTDLLVVSSQIPEKISERMDLLAAARKTAPEVEAVGWTITEWERRKAAGDDFAGIILAEGIQIA